MALDRYIREATGTEATLKALPARVPALTTDTDKYMIGNNAGDKRYEFAFNRYWNGAAWVDCDTQFKNITASSDFIAAGGYLTTSEGVYTDSIHLETDTITISAGAAGYLTVGKANVNSSVSMYMGSNESPASFTTDGGLSIDKRNTMYTDSMTLLALSNTTRSFNFGSSSVEGSAEIWSAGKFDSIGSYHLRAALAFSFSSNNLSTAGSSTIYELAGETAALSFSLGAIGANNQFTVQIHNNKDSQYIGSFKYDFLIDSANGVGRV